MKLHLGCGQRYFQGYVNIDYPLNNHSVQTSSKADIHANILDLKYPNSTIDEVRLHHVFEHFRRYDAIALLCAWNSWLKPNGVLHIEVPDLFLTSLSASLNPFASKRLVAERHLFGSHEAHWAVHYEGWSIKNLKKVAHLLGFKLQKAKRTSWMGTYNIELFFRKARSLSPTEVNLTARQILKMFTLDNSKGEMDLLQIWVNNFTNSLQKMIHD